MMLNAMRFTDKSVHRDDGGGSAIEYALIASIIGLAVVSPLQSTKASLNTMFSCVATKIDASTSGSTVTGICSAAQARADAAVSQAYLLALFPGKQVDTTAMAQRTGAVNLSNGLLFSDLGVMSQTADGSWTRSTPMSNSVDGSTFAFGSAVPGIINDGMTGTTGSYRQDTRNPNVFIANSNANFVLYKTDFGYYGLIMK